MKIITVKVEYNIGDSGRYKEFNIPYELVKSPSWFESILYKFLNETIGDMVNGIKISYMIKYKE